MSKKNKKKNKKKRNRLGAPRPKPIPAEKLNVEGTIQKIRSALDGGDAREALRLAKMLFAQEADGASEEILVKSYSSRILQLLRANLTQEATALLDVALTKHPDFSEHLTEVSLATWVVVGNWRQLLSNYDACSDSERSAIDDAIRQWTPNPKEPAECDVLPIDHPLRVAAGCVAEALERVTKEIVPGAELQLRQVSRRSPFAPWVLLVRAIAAFYRQENDSAADLAGRVPQNSAPRPIADALIDMIDERIPKTQQGSSLQMKVLPRRTRIASMMEEIDQDLQKGRKKPALKTIRKLLNEVRRSMPEITQSLMQHLSVRCFFNELSATDVTRAMGRASLKNAAFWRLFAAAYDTKFKRAIHPTRILEGCFAWNEFLYHAEAEELLTGDSIAAAAVYFRMAENIASLPEFSLEHYREMVEAVFSSGCINDYKTYATGQPDDLSLRLRRDRTDEFLLLPEALFDRATQLYPNTEMFAKWYHWTHETAPDINDDEKVLELWHKRCPKDITPLIHLGTNYLERGSFKKAEGVLRKGRKLDPLNASINQLYRKALSIGARRHIKQAKPHLLENDIAALTSLMTHADASGKAYLAILRALSALSVNETDKAAACIQEVKTLLDDNLVVRGLLLVVAEQCNLPQKKLTPLLPKAPRGKKGIYTTALAKIVAMCNRIASPLSIPEGWTKRISAEMKGNLSAFGREELTAAAQAALADEEFELLYAISTAGLRLGSAGYADFLWYRGQSLPLNCFGHATVLFHAAACRARRQGNSALADKAMKDALEMLEEGAGYELGKAEHDKLKIDVPDDRIDDMVSIELQIPQCPPSAYADDLEFRYREALLPDNDECDCPRCRAARGEDVQPWEFEDWIFDDDDDDDDEIDDNFDGGPFDTDDMEELARAIVEMTGLKPNPTKRELERATQKFMDTVGNPFGLPRSKISGILKMLAQSNDKQMEFLFEPPSSPNRSGKPR